MTSPPPAFPYVVVPVRGDDDAELVVAELFGLGATGTEDQERGATMNAPEASTPRAVVGWFPTEPAAAAAAASLAPRWEAAVGTLLGDDWRDGWRAWFEPRRVGGRLWVRPPWKAPPDAGAGDLVVTVDPGRAFGTGTHETTRLLLAALDDRVRGGERVLDVGCGSGILGVAAVLLGASSAVGTDVDPDAVGATGETARLNGVGDRVQASTRDLAALPPEDRFDVVLANIEAGVLVDLRRDLAARLGPGGWLGLSGVIAPREDEVRGAFEDLGLAEGPVHRDGDWVALFYTLPPTDGGVR